LYSDKLNQRMLKALRQRGIRLTPQRLEIVRILTHDRTHPGARAILSRAQAKVPYMSISTVYYTLGLLKKEGLIKELGFYSMGNRYESEMTDHIDLICTKCRKIINFEKELPVTRQLIEKATGFEAHEMRCEYYGVCVNCRGKKINFFDL